MNRMEIENEVIVLPHLYYQMVRIIIIENELKDVQRLNHKQMILKS